MERHVAILIADGFADSGLSVALDVLRTANALAARAGRTPTFRVQVVSARGGRVKAASGLQLDTTRSARAAARADVLIVPGLWCENVAELETALERDDVRSLVRAIRSAHARGAIVASSCSGAFLLAEAGVLDGREATTTWWLAQHLKRRRPQVAVDAERALVVDGRVLSAGAVFAQADVALHLVSQFAGPTVARRCADLLLLDRHASQTPYMAVHQLAANEPTVRRAEAWVRAHLAERFDVATLARSVGTSPRTLARRLAGAAGVSVIGFIQRVRIETATHLLETTRLSVAEISARVGYDDPSTLRRLLERETKATPREIRRRRHASAAPPRTARGAPATSRR